MTRHSTLLAAALAALFAALPAIDAVAATKLSFEQVLARAEEAHGVPPSAIAAVDLLEKPPRRIHFPVLRIETTAQTANHVDFLARNILGYDAVTSLLSVDYPLIDGGIRGKQLRLSQLDAQAFRYGLRESADQLFRETLDAVAKLYGAQERQRILNAGLQRAVGMRDRAKQKLKAKEISNVTASQWQDEAIVAESQLLDLELQRLEAETHVRQLIGDTSGDPLELVLDLDAPIAITSSEPQAPPAFQFERAKLALDEAMAARKPQLTMSAFGGITALSDVAGGDGGFGLFGITFSLALPMFDGATARRVAEARLRTEQADLDRRALTEQLHRQYAAMLLGVTSLEKRIGLLSQMVDVARRREESVTRLAAAGVRPENDVATAGAELARRESDLVGARVELWKARRVLQRKSGAAQ